jgi:hypothetical protein
MVANGIAARLFDSQTPGQEPTRKEERRRVLE